jgi:hypothetical protein
MSCQTVYFLTKYENCLNFSVVTSSGIIFNVWITMALKMQIKQKKIDDIVTENWIIKPGSGVFFCEG